MNWKCLRYGQRFKDRCGCVLVFDSRDGHRFYFGVAKHCRTCIERSERLDVPLSHCLSLTSDPRTDLEAV